jgi:hypothetical protein
VQRQAWVTRLWRVGGTARRFGAERAYWLAFFFVAESIVAGDYRAGAAPGEGVLALRAGLVLVSGIGGFALCIAIWRRVRGGTPLEQLARPDPLPRRRWHIVCSGRRWICARADPSQALSAGSGCGHRAWRRMDIFISGQRIRREDFTCDTSSAAWLVHELTHVWQHQSGRAVRVRGLLEQFSRLWGRDPYRYGRVDRSRSFEAYGLEQQASMVEDMYRLSVGLPPRKGSGSLADYRAVIRFS